MPHTAPSHAHLAPLLCPPSAFPHPTASPYPGSVQLLQKPAGDGARELSACSQQPPELCRAGCSLPLCTQQDPSAPSSYSLMLLGPWATGFDIFFSIAE